MHTNIKYKHTWSDHTECLWRRDLCFYAERGVCANGLRQKLGEGAGDPEAGEQPLHHRAEGWRRAHAQITQGLPAGRQLGHHPHRHHQEHRPCPGQAQGGRAKCEKNYFDSGKKNRRTINKSKPVFLDCGNSDNDVKLHEIISACCGVSLEIPPSNASCQDL